MPVPVAILAIEEFGTLDTDEPDCVGILNKSILLQMPFDRFVICKRLPINTLAKKYGDSGATQADATCVVVINEEIGTSIPVPPGLGSLLPDDTLNQT
jgi:hypothetical protein